MADPVRVFFPKSGAVEVDSGRLHKFERRTAFLGEGRSRPPLEVFTAALICHNRGAACRFIRGEHDPGEIRVTVHASGNSPQVIAELESRSGLSVEPTPLESA